MLKINALFLIIVLPLSLCGMERPLPDLNNPLVLLDCHLTEDIVQILERKFTCISYSVDYAEIDHAFEDATALMNNPSIHEYKHGEFLQDVKSVRIKLFKKIASKFPTLISAINAQQGLADDFYPGQEFEDKLQKEDVQVNVIPNALKTQLEQERVALEARLLALEQKQKTDNERKEQQIASLEKEVTNQRWILNGFKIGTAVAAGVGLYIVHRNANAPTTPDNSSQVGFLESSFKRFSNTFESLRSAFTTNSEKTNKRIKALEDGAKGQTQINKDQATINKDIFDLQKRLKAVEERPTVEIEDQAKSGNWHGHRISIIDKDGKKELIYGAEVVRTSHSKRRK